jgi:hypothetical protein
MKTIITKTTEIILTSVEELKNLPDGTKVQEGEYSEKYGFDYDTEDDFAYRKEADGLRYRDYYGNHLFSWDEVADTISDHNKVYRVSKTMEVIVADGKE